MELPGTVRLCGHIEGMEVWYVSNTVHADWYLIDLNIGLVGCGRLSDLEQVHGRMVQFDNPGCTVQITYDKPTVGTKEVKTSYSKLLWCASHPKGVHDKGWVTEYRQMQNS